MFLVSGFWSGVCSERGISNATAKGDNFNNEMGGKFKSNETTRLLALHMISHTLNCKFDKVVPRADVSHTSPIPKNDNLSNEEQ